MQEQRPEKSAREMPRATTAGALRRLPLVVLSSQKTVLGILLKVDLFLIERVEFIVEFLVFLVIVPVLGSGLGAIDRAEHPVPALDRLARDFVATLGATHFRLPQNKFKVLAETG